MRDVVLAALMIVLPGIAGALDEIRSEREDILGVQPLSPDRVRMRVGGDVVVGGRTIRARWEGGTEWSESFRLVPDSAAGGAGFLHYQCLVQDPGVPKARAEHYLHLAPMRRTYLSEFSMKLDASFTPVELARPDGGPNWCILHQWHQSAPESPAIALAVRPGTSRCLEWAVIHGQSKAEGARRVVFGVSEVELDHWYHFRVRWCVDPGDGQGVEGAGRCEVAMAEHRLPRELTAAEVRFRYAGPIGYWGRSGHEGDRIREQIGIYQGPHQAPGSHHGISIAHLAVYPLAEPDP